MNIKIFKIFKCSLSLCHKYKTDSGKIMFIHILISYILCINAHHLIN